MEPMESCSVPPGFRFHPTEEELVGYYLRKKVASQKIDLDVIKDIDLYRIEPWDLQERCRIGYEEQNEWYFFSHKDKKYPTGTRTNRATMAGFWKATGRDKAVYDKSKLMGMRKTLVFYKGRAPNGQKTDWIMHEYRLESDENGPPQEEGWVICRAFKKRTNTTQLAKNKVAWGSSYFYEEAANIGSSVIRQQQHTNFFPQNLITCKQENTNQGNNPEGLSSFFHQPDQFIQLPQLESPSMTAPTAKRRNSSTTTTPESYRKEKSEVTADWRDLDRFVASQLMSHEEENYNKKEETGDVVCGFGGEKSNDDDSEMGSLLMLQNVGDEENKFISGFLNSDDSDIGIFLLDN